MVEQREEDSPWDWWLAEFPGNQERPHGPGLACGKRRRHGSLVPNPWPWLARNTASQLCRVPSCRQSGAGSRPPGWARGRNISVLVSWLTVRLRNHTQHLRVLRCKGYFWPKMTHIWFDMCLWVYSRIINTSRYIILTLTLSLTEVILSIVSPLIWYATRG